MSIATARQLFKDVVEFPTATARVRRRWPASQKWQQPSLSLAPGGGLKCLALSQLPLSLPAVEVEDRERAPPRGVLDAYDRAGGCWNN